MHVVHPYPTVWKPSFSRYGVRPALARYSVTVFDPGASEVFTHAGVLKPFSTAFFASNPAAISTEGFEVFVQEVIAAITTLPCFKEFFTEAETCSCTFGSSTPIAAGLPPSASQRFSVPLFAAAAAAGLVFGLISEGNALLNDSPACDNTTRSCGRFGPARLDSTVARSSERSSEYSASGVFGTSLARSR